MLFSLVDSVFGYDLALFDPSEYQLGNLSEGRIHNIQIRLQNRSGLPLHILSVDPTCVYLEAEVDKTTVAQDETAIVTVHIDTNGNLGRLAKTIEILTDKSPDPHILTLHGIITHPEFDRNNAKAIFETTCKNCHVGKNVQLLQGEHLYDKLCYICHKEAVKLKKIPRSILIRTISNGIPGTSMPGFIDSAKGPLSAEQIGSLADYFIRQQRADQ
jgi:hypothetical protein